MTTFCIFKAKLFLIVRL